MVARDIRECDVHEGDRASSRRRTPWTFGSGLQRAGEGPEWWYRSTVSGRNAAARVILVVVGADTALSHGIALCRLDRRADHRRRDCALFARGGQRPTHATSAKAKTRGVVHTRTKSTHPTIGSAHGDGAKLTPCLAAARSVVIACNTE